MASNRKRELRLNPLSFSEGIFLAVRFVYLFRYENLLKHSTTPQPHVPIRIGADIIAAGLASGNTRNV